MIAGSLCGESRGTVVGYLIGYGHTNTWTQTRVKNGTHNRQLSVKPAIDMNLVTPKCIARVIYFRGRTPILHVQNDGLTNRDVCNRRLYRMPCFSSK